MAVKRYNIVTSRSYESNGETKKAWMNVGRLTFFPANGDKAEGYKIELNMFPNTQFSVFEERPREARPAPAEAANDAFDAAMGDVLF